RPLPRRRRASRLTARRAARARRSVESVCARAHTVDVSRDVPVAWRVESPGCAARSCGAGASARRLLCMWAPVLGHASGCNPHHHPPGACTGTGFCYAEIVRAAVLVMVACSHAAAPAPEKPVLANVAAVHSCGEAAAGI